MTAADLLTRLEGLAARPGAEADEILSRIDLAALAARAEHLGRELLARPGGEADAELRRAAWDLLDLLRRPALLRRIAPEERGSWAGRILELVDGSRFTVGPLFRQRAERLGSQILFEEQVGGRRRTWSWRRVASRVELVARGLASLDAQGDPSPVAILSENRLEMALLDLACLTSGVVNVMIPANASDGDVGYMLRHCGARVAVVSGAGQLRKVLKHREALPALERIVTIEPQPSDREGVVALENLLAAAERVDGAAVRRRAEVARTSDLATVMYTSGTTGKPKGIRFSHRNIVFKRFARALAVPEIGEGDVFLCFLPLYHTFGRYLELLGCVFWGARYCLVAHTSVDSLVAGMRRHRPTVFISVPKKWLELHERITRQADPLTATDAELAAATRRVTGGQLRWGLSAAGQLDPEVFRFFQRQGIELASGFGMTEATGGITMTLPGQYRDGSLGTALPGIELRLADDGELAVRGPYVMLGYLDPPEGERAFDAEGWLHTGDLMEIDADGHLRLIDRKKEIFKNVQGETIAPQRVENLFRDFESVGRALLVGDQREYNTLLIWPNPAYDQLDFSTLSKAEIADHFRSLVVSVNKFLAPYERVVDFAIIDRDLDPTRGELTPKGTPRRKVVEQHFADAIRPLYRRASLHAGGVELVLPNWLFQLLGLTARDLDCGEDRITLPASGTSLTVRRRGPRLAQVGSCLYRHAEGPISLGALLTTARLWLGNEELVGFVPLDAVTRQRSTRGAAALQWAGRVAAYPPSDADRRLLEACAGRPAELDLLDMDLAARMLGAAEDWDALRAVGLLEALLEAESSPQADTARLLLARMADSPSPAVRRCAFLVLLPAERESRFKEVLRRFLLRDPAILDAEGGAALSERDLSDAKVGGFIDLAQDASTGRFAGARGAGLAASLLRFLAEFGAAHPARYRRFRAFLVRMALSAVHPEVRAQAARASERLEQGFRQWLGPNSSIAVDPETAQEYRWDDVVVFGDDVPDLDRRRILSAIKQTVFLREGAFLFCMGASVRLGDVPPGGVWVRWLGSQHGKSVYRVTIQTREESAYDLAVNVNHELTPEQVREELQWLILSGDPANRGPLVEDFGGYWPEQDLWSEEFIAGETLHRAMLRLARNPGQVERFRQLWPFLAWSTLAAYADFWHRSGKRLELADPSMANVIVPTEDFQSGARIVSLSRRRPHRGLVAMLRSFRDEFVAPAEQQYPALAGLVGWELVFSAVAEVTGEAERLALFRGALADADSADDGELGPELGEFVRRVETQGFMPMRLHFAVQRFRRWAGLSADATPQAQAETLRELYDTYRLEQLVEAHPELRVRLFRETVFRDGPASLVAGLDEMIRRIRRGELGPEELIPAVDELRARLDPGSDAEYFLARLSYPYLRPEDAAGFVRSQLGGRRQSEIVVTLEDHDGNAFRVRHALSPKEVERLHRLFLAAKLDVRFRPEHHYLVAINERSLIIAGIYYDIDEEARSAHLEKIVVAERHRRRGVAEGLMKEFFNRLRAAGAKTVTTGFFRPEYFYGYGFRIEKRYAGLVKSLEEEAAGAP